MKCATLLFTLLAVALATESFAQRAGDLDSSFGGVGKVITNISGGGYDNGNAAAIQPDGFIVVAGNTVAGNTDSITRTHVAIVRYNPKGALDNTFGTDGILLTEIQGSNENSVAIQSDGKIVVAGTYYFFDTSERVFAAVRYNADGSPDSSFSMDGMALTKISKDDQGYAVAIQPDGKILVAGWGHDTTAYLFVVVRYNQDGSPDSSFNDDGIVTTQPRNGVNICSAMTLQQDGKIVVAGYASSAPYADFAVIRYNPDGSLDSSFSTDGIVFTDIGSSNESAMSIAIQPDSKIVVSGFVLESNGNKSDFALVRYNPDGSLDHSFSSDGIVTTDFGTSEGGYSVAIQSDGKIVVAGETRGNADSDFAIARYNADGSLDNSFGTNGKVITDFGYGYDFGYYVGIQPNGRIIVAGTSWNGTDNDFAVARYLAELNVGLIDFSPAENVVIYPNPIHNNETLEYSLQQDEVLSISLYDMGGRLVQEFISNESRSKGNHKESLQFKEDLPGGNYLLTITNVLGSVSVKVAKQ